MTVRVQIPVYTDRWMRGDRYGVLVKTTNGKRNVTTLGVRGCGDGKYNAKVKIAHVKLDKSGKTIKVLLDDCEWLP